MSKKSSTFAPAFEKALLNGVMVALQILVLSVWVRVLVEQQKRRGATSSFSVIPPLPLLPPVLGPVGDNSD